MGPFSPVEGKVFTTRAIPTIEVVKDIDPKSMSIMIRDLMTVGFTPGQAFNLVVLGYLYAMGWVRD